MYVRDGRVVTSPSDLTLASACEYSFALQLDAKLGKNVTLPQETKDPIQERAKVLGDAHENRRLEHYRQAGPVVDLPRPGHNLDALRDAAAATLAALQGPRPGRVPGHVLRRDGSRPPARRIRRLPRTPARRPLPVQDTKLARSAKVSALLQLAGYHEQLVRLGIPVDDTVEVILGTDETVGYPIADIAPVYRARRARLVEIIRERMDDPAAVAWGDPRYAIDGRCDACEAQVIETRDLLLVAGIRVTQRAKLAAAGIHSIDDLAANPERPDGCDVPLRTYAGLHAQAALQVSAAVDRRPARRAAVRRDRRRPAGVVSAAARPRRHLLRLRGGSALQRAGDGSPAWNLDYLFGLVDRDEKFTAFWAHSLAEEKTALVEFLDYLRERLTEHPGMHVYHYASYERTHLLSLAARHGVGETFVDELLRDGVLVDLYPLVRKSVRVGGRSYSIKKLEPLYMGDELRADDGVTNAGDSVEQYNEFDRRGMPVTTTLADGILDDIADYNELRLRLDAAAARLAARARRRERTPPGHHPGRRVDRVPSSPARSPMPSSSARWWRARPATSTAPSPTTSPRPPSTSTAAKTRASGGSTTRA